VVNREQTALFLLNFSIAIYVRDAGVAGSNPATPTILSMTYNFDVMAAQRNAQRIDPLTRLYAAHLRQFLSAAASSAIS
jgi:hypothetical protein